MLAASKALGMFRKYIVMSFRRRALEHGPMDGLHLYCLTRRRAFVIFSAYYDESGTHADSPVTVLAGLIGPVDDWVPFERDWRMVLKKHNLTHVRGKHLYHRQKQHKGWTDKQVTLLWADILYALQERKGFVITQTVLNNREYLSSYVRDGSIGKERLDTKYALCLRACLNFHPVVHEQAYGNWLCRPCAGERPS